MSIVAGDDEGNWLSNTIQMVETVMVQHGFVNDRSEKAAIPGSRTPKQRKRLRSLAAASRLVKKFLNRLRNSAPHNPPAW